jgi:hypothetical protein
MGINKICVALIVFFVFLGVSWGQNELEPTLSSPSDIEPTLSSPSDIEPTLSSPSDIGTVNPTSNAAATSIQTNTTNNSTSVPVQNTGVPYGLFAVGAILIAFGAIYARFLNKNARKSA